MLRLNVKKVGSEQFLTLFRDKYMSSYIYKKLLYKKFTYFLLHNI